jgi:hypothetical protein
LSVNIQDRAPRLGPRSSAPNVLLAALAGGFALVALAIGGTATSVWPPALLLLSVTAMLIIREWLRERGRAPLNAGVLYMAVITLYGVYPLLEFAALDGLYTPLNDPRLYDIQPRIGVVSRIGWYYVAYAAAFLGAYVIATRDQPRLAAVVVQRTDASVLWAVVLIFLALRGLVLVADLAFAQDSGNYVESYLRYSHLPLLLQQLIGHANGMLSVLGIALVAVACLNWRRARLPLLVWLALELLNLVTGGGSRTDFVLLVLALTVAYHQLVRPIPFSVLTTGGVALVGGFLALGAMRAYQGGDVVGAGLEVLSSANEFESLFGNAIDLDRMVESGRVDRSSLASAVYLGDIIGLVPQQLMPVEKVNLSRWYVETFYNFHAELGGGFAFGVIAEAIVGAGPVDLLWRALLVGFGLGWLDRRMRSAPVGLPMFVFYVWVVSSAYLMFRITTLALVPIFVYRVVPVLLAVMVLAELLALASRPMIGGRPRPAGGS